MTPPAQWDLEFADSEVRDMQRHGADLHLVFSAAAAHGLDASGMPVRGFLQGVTLVLHHCAVDVAQVLFTGRVRSGRCMLRAGPPRQTLRIPADWPEPLVLELESAQGGLLVLQAQGLSCCGVPDGAFRESLFC